MDIKQFRQYIANKSPKRQLNEQSSVAPKALALVRKAHDKITDSNPHFAAQSLVAAQNLLKTDPSYKRPVPPSKVSLEFLLHSVLTDLDFAENDGHDDLLDIKYQIEDILDILHNLSGVEESVNITESHQKRQDLAYRLAELGNLSPNKAKILDEIDQIWSDIDYLSDISSIKKRRILDNVDELTDAVKTSQHSDAEILINTIIKDLLSA
jgi:hypothetical protein